MRSVAKKVLPWAASIVLLTWAMVSGRGIAGPGDPPSPPEGVPPEPITGDAEDGFPVDPSDATGPIHPFEPPPADPSDIQIEDLSADEQAYVEAGMNTSAWPAIHSAFSAATAQAAEESGAEADAFAVGIQGLSRLGVVQ